MKSSSLVFGLSGVVAAGLIGFAVWQGAQPSAYTDFAACLTDQEVKMYGAWWCPHCKAQKEVFGRAFEEIAYIECSDASKNMLPVCIEAGITGVPVWEFADGTRLNGEQTLTALADKTSCEIPVTP